MPRPRSNRSSKTNVSKPQSSRPTWLAALSGSVRPVVTYLIIVEWLAINWAIAWLIIDEEGITVYNLRAILDTDFMGLVSCVIAFWFGNRTFGKRKT